MANFTQEQLDLAKSLLEGGKLFYQMRDDLGIERAELMSLRREVMNHFGNETIVPLIRAARGSGGGIPFSGLAERVRKMNLDDVDRVNSMVANLQAAIDELNAIKANIV